jgi:hypothetical protein
MLIRNILYFDKGLLLLGYFIENQVNSEILIISYHIVKITFSNITKRLKRRFAASIY